MYSDYRCDACNHIPLMKIDVIQLCISSCITTEMGRCSECAQPGNTNRTCKHSTCSGGVCSICLDSLNRHETSTLQSCGHTFHARCLDTWLLAQHTCPLCRTPGTPAELPEKYVVVEINSSGRIYWWCGNQLVDETRDATFGVQWGLPSLQPKMVFVEGKTWSSNVSQCIHATGLWSNDTVDTILPTEVFESTLYAHVSTYCSQPPFRVIPRPPDFDDNPNHNPELDRDPASEAHTTTPPS
jgi:hypothetical protein